MLISGGASALWCAPAPGHLARRQAPRDRAPAARASVEIRELNTVRRHLSALKGGGLARAARGRPVHAVRGLGRARRRARATSARGRRAPTRRRFADALAVAARGTAARRELPRARARAPRARRRGELARREAGDPRSRSARARGRVARRRARRGRARAARRAACACASCPTALYGEVGAVARALAGAGARARAPTASSSLVAGGEPTVVVRGSGRGGRAQELALRLALELGGRARLRGALRRQRRERRPDRRRGRVRRRAQLARARARAGSTCARTSRGATSHPLLAATGDLYVTGPTETNVADLALGRLLRLAVASARVRRSLWIVLAVAGVARRAARLAGERRARGAERVLHELSPRREHAAPRRAAPELRERARREPRVGALRARRRSSAASTATAARASRTGCA